MANSVLDPVFANWLTIACLLGFFIFFKILASPSFKGWLGERMVKSGVQQLGKEHYRNFHDLYLPQPNGKGTTQIDHVVVSPFGIFVIETKNCRGWIFGSEKQREWTQQIYRHKTRFQNPLDQNKLHVRALMEFLGLPEDRFKSVVFFAGNAEFKTPMPGNVINHGLRAWISRHTSRLLQPAEFGRACAALQALEQTTDSRAVARRHVAVLRNRASS